MNFEKKGYRSALDVKREALTKIAKAWLADGARVLVGAAIALALIFVVSFLQGCGGKSGGSAPVHDDAGVCVANCSNECPSCGYFEYIDGKQICMLNNCVNNGDGWVWADGHARYYGDSLPTYADGKLIPQPDTEPYVCPMKEPPKICILYTNTYCAGFSLDGSLVPCGGSEDTTNGQGCGCSLAYSPEQVYCKTDYECQIKPKDTWPPCVCWGLPCQLVGEWACSSGSVMDFTDMKFYDNGDGYCRMHFPQHPSGDLYNKPGDDHVQRPPSGEPVEEKYTILDNGSQLLGESPDGDGIYFYTCTKVVEGE